MFLGPWHEMKKKPKNPIYLVIFRAQIQSLTLEVYFAATGCRYQRTNNRYLEQYAAEGCTEPTAGTWSSVQQDAAPLVSHARRPYCLGNAAFPWPCCGATCRALTRGPVKLCWHPLVYKYPILAQISKKEGMQCSSSHLCSLVVLFFSFVFSFIDHVIGKRVILRMKVRVLVMEGDTL